MKQSYRRGGGECSRCMTRRERGGVRNSDQGVHRRIGERRPRAVGQLLQKHGQPFCCTCGERGEERGHRQHLPSDGVADSPDECDQRPLHPPDRRDEEELCEWTPAELVRQPDRGAVPLGELTKQFQQTGHVSPRGKPWRGSGQLRTSCAKARERVQAEKILCGPWGHRGVRAPRDSPLSQGHGLPSSRESECRSRPLRSTAT